MSNNPSINTGINVTPTQVEVLYAKTSVIYHQVTSKDLRSISVVNGVVTVCIALGTLFLGVLLGCGWDIVKDAGSRTAGEISFVIGCGVFALASVCLGLFFMFFRGLEIKEILGERDKPRRKELSSPAFWMVLGFVLLMAVIDRGHSAYVEQSAAKLMLAIGFGVGLVVVVIAWWKARKSQP